jgi:GAF domain-containing protein
VPPPPDPILHAVLRSAVDATGAAHGWVLVTEDDELVVRATTASDPAMLTARVPATSGYAGYVASSGQPLAMSPRRGDERSGQGIAALLGIRPSSVLAVPCGSDAVIGVLELVDKVAGGPFTFDDVELVTLLAGIAGEALVAGRDVAVDVPSPHQLGDDLLRLSATDPARYATVAALLGALLANG